MLRPSYGPWRPLLLLPLSSSLLQLRARRAQTAPSRAAEQIWVGPGRLGHRALAYELFSYGQQAKGALAIVTATSLMAKVQATETNREKTRRASAGGEDAGKATPFALTGLAHMLAPKIRKGTLQ